MVNHAPVPGGRLRQRRFRSAAYSCHGTDFGVFFLKNGKKNWARLGAGLPNAPVFDLKLTGDGNVLYAATFGRGIYQIPVPSA